MILISHRGNINGKNINKENNPTYIETAIGFGYDVEIDIRYIDKRFFLGHDIPQYEIKIKWLEKNLNNIWIHCKDLNSFSYFNQYNLINSKKFNYFSHDTDIGVLTSHNYIWSTHICNGGILVLPEIFNTSPTSETIGVCSDIISTFSKR